jgi:hypothetical protein
MSTNHQFIFGGSPVPAGFKFGGLQQELEDAEVHTAQLELELADALEQKQLLGGQRDKAVKAEAVAQRSSTSSLLMDSFFPLGNHGR